MLIIFKTPLLANLAVNLL